MVAYGMTKNLFILCFVGKLTEERDLWSSAAYTLSLKVTDKHSLNTAKKLHLCEKAWAKLSRHFAIFLSEKDSIQVSVSEALHPNCRVNKERETDCDPFWILWERLNCTVTYPTYDRFDLFMCSAGEKRRKIVRATHVRKLRIRVCVLVCSDASAKAMWIQASGLRACLKRIQDDMVPCEHSVLS